ncbi:MAG: cadmium-translocating P-type ATPase [Rhodoplanes sp.]|uniref:heavy metal translocating P-type ATPase n=1 Tax=Rhodoplanes sp. TaxID=1968906 RepID=UPI0017E6B0C5|nr:heavy metal translocating P-type ATPase [Rhodoplanes sp.]NVO13652.1 cadmium-translocating P-type ATPase [Rhodoplanes sp.]
MSDVVETRFRVAGMDCGSCAAKVEAAVSRLPGVETVAVSATAGTMTVTHAPDTRLLPALRTSLTALGYDVTPTDGPDKAAGGDLAPSDDHAHADAPGDVPWWKSRKGTATIACGIALVAAYVVGKIEPEIAWWAFLAALAVGLVPVARRALAALRNGTPFSIEMLMTIAAVGAVVIGAAEEAAMVVFLFLVGEMLEGVAAGRARASIRSLTALVPKTALVERDGRVEAIAADRLAVGAVILVRPGDRIAADGIIVAGEAALDEAPVTGESMPVRKGPGATVFAGAIDTDAVLRVRVTAAAQDNTIARVVRLVEEAQEAKAPTERFIDRFSRWYTPAVVAVAALVAVVPPLLLGASWDAWIYKGLALLLIGCPCALVISTPAAIAAALSAGARSGLLVKGGAVLENLGTITDAAFDKTGTLTEGKPKVTDLLGVSRDTRQVLSMAAALETGSSHPLARAILERAAADRAPVPPAADVKIVPGKGLGGRFGGEILFLGSAEAAAERATLDAVQRAKVAGFERQGKTVAVLVAGDTVAGLIAMRDEPRADAAAGLRALEAAGITTVMLTGDNRHTAAAIAADLGIVAHGGLLPEDKQRIVRELQALGKSVAKIGDGINDAPALAAATVGIAMGGGTDVALETADAAILHGRVLDVARMIALSRATMANIRQNITIALGLKAVFLFTTILGITGLWPAILADTGATVLVTANAMRLLAWRM